MDFGKEVNAFKDWLLNHDLPSSAIVLWYTLMNIKQGTGKKGRFNAPSSVVEHLTGLSKQGVAKARAKLVENKLIVHHPGKVGVSPVYEIVSLINFVEQSDDQSVEQVAYQLGTENVDQLDKRCKSVDQFGYQSEQQMEVVDQFDESLVERKLTVLKRDKEEKRRKTCEEKPFEIYEKNFGILRPILRESLIAWCEDLGDEIVIAAMKLTAQMGGKTFSYLETILKEWVNAGLETLEQVEAYQIKKQAKYKEKTVAFRKQVPDKKKTLFDELRREIGS